MRTSYRMQRSAGLYGLIRVVVPAGVVQRFAYDYDRSIILNDWWHASTYEQAAGLNAIPIGWVGEPHSLLINGRGKFNCALASPAAGECNATSPEFAPYVLTIIPGKTYRFCIASITFLSSLNFEIEEMLIAAESKMEEEKAKGVSRDEAIDSC